MDYGVPQDEIQRDEQEMEGETDDYHIIRSGRVPLPTNYAVGVFRGQELHITPLHTVYQMRPEFDRINKADEERKKKFVLRKNQGFFSSFS